MIQEVTGAIIAGHGAGSEHNRGFDQVDNLPFCNEGDNNFFIAEEIISYANKTYYFNFSTIRKRRENNPSLIARGNAGDGKKIALFIHSNYVSNKSVSGVEIFPDTWSPDYTLANKLGTNLGKTLGIPFRGVISRTFNNPNNFSRIQVSKQTNYYAENRYSDAEFSAIVEIAYHGNPSDARKLRTRHKDIAESIVDTLAAYYKVPRRGGQEVITTPPAEVIKTNKYEINLIKDIPGYLSVEDLKTNYKPITAKAGKYYIYKTYEGYTNISVDPDYPGKWVDLRKALVWEDLKEDLVTMGVVLSGNWERNLNTEQLIKVYEFIKKKGVI